MPVDICVTIIRNRRNTNRATGDVFRVWEIGDDPASGQFPATLDPGPPKIYTPKESIDPGTRTFAYVFCTGVPAAGVDRAKHWEQELFDPAFPEEDYLHRHKARLILDDLPVPRKAELNQANYTTVRWSNFLSAMRIKLVAGGERPATEGDV